MLGRWSIKVSEGAALKNMPINFELKKGAAVHWGTEINKVKMRIY